MKIFPVGGLFPSQKFVAFCRSLNAKKDGREQYEAYVKNRLSGAKDSIFLPIKKNKYFISPESSNEVSSVKNKLNSLKKDCGLFSRLLIACQVRQGDLRKFFSRENQGHPPALSENGKLYFGTKRDILSCMEDLHVPKDEIEEYGPSR